MRRPARVMTYRSAGSTAAIAPVTTCAPYSAATAASSMRRAWAIVNGSATAIGR